ncbi:hypothetical protein ACW0US_17785 [Xanthomonas euvesicatoria]
MSEDLSQFSHYESLMIHIAALSSWEFVDGDDLVPVELVFNHSTYAAGLLKLSEQELELRGSSLDLRLNFQEDEDATLGCSVTFMDGTEQERYSAQMLRLLHTQYAVDHLPKIGGAYDLSPLHNVFALRSAPEVA